MLRKARRKGWFGKLVGLSADLLHGIEQRIVRVAAAVEMFLMRLVRSYVQLPMLPPVGRFMGQLTPAVDDGVGKMLSEAERVQRVATNAGRKVAKRDLEMLGKSGVTPPKSDVADVAGPAKPDDVVKPAGGDMLELLPPPNRDVKDLLAKAPKQPRTPEHGTTVRTPASLKADIEGVRDRVLGEGSALYQRIAADMLANPPESEAARLRIAQKHVDEFAKRGVTGFVDAGGRRWQLTSFVEMATRTAAQRIANEAYLNAVSARGFDVVRMNTMPNCSDLCQPLQGRLFSITGATAGSLGGVPIEGTVAEAYARGYAHPGCRHSFTVWVPGLPFTNPDLIDAGDYAASQELRRLERKVREWKRREAAALSDVERRRCGVKVRQWQARIRAHVAETGVPRLRHREQFGRVL